VPSDRPMIELVIPSSLDKTLAPEGAHVCLLFTQFTPMSPSNGSWEDPTFKEKYANSVFNIVEQYAPGFKESIVGKEVLTPWDLEQTFGLTGGVINVVAVICQFVLLQ
jgi:phytoene dehydrogenase-like protein